MSLLDRLVAIWKQEHPEEQAALSIPAPGSGMARRRFLQVLAGSAAVAAVAPLVDLEQLLWTPGQTIVAPELYQTGFITASWLTREMLRALQNNMTLVSMVDRQWDDRWVKVQGCLGSRVKVANRRKPVVLTDQLGLDLNIDPAYVAQPHRPTDVIERIIAPAAASIASMASQRRLTAFGELDIPRGVMDACRCTAPTGLSVRTIQHFDARRGGSTVMLTRFDVLAGKV